MMDEVLTKMDDLEKSVINLKTMVANNETKISFLKMTLRDCRNELCLKCGSYSKAHLGACDCCRWKDEWRGALE